MAIERDAGPGGIIGPQLPEVQPDEVLVEELPQDPGVFEFDDGSAIVGEYEEEHTYPGFCDNPTCNYSPNHKRWSRAPFSFLHIKWDHSLLLEGIG